LLRPFFFGGIEFRRLRGRWLVRRQGEAGLQGLGRAAMAAYDHLKAWIAFVLALVETAADVDQRALAAGFALPCGMPVRAQEGQVISSMNCLASVMELPLLAGRGDASMVIGTVSSNLHWIPLRISIQALMILSLSFSRRWKVPLFRKVSRSRWMPRLANTESGTLAMAWVLAGALPIWAMV
jgi:hypothetical protein